MRRLLLTVVLACACGLCAASAASAQVQVVTVVNQAHVRPAVLARVERAIVLQSAQIAAAWGTPTVAFGSGGWMVYLKIGRYLGPWGVHANPVAVQADGSLRRYPPYALVWTAGSSALMWSSVLSHEIAEMLADPYQTSYAGSGCPGCAGSTLEEIDDPVHQRTYPLRGVNVADFVLPSYYQAGSAGPWDHMRTLRGALSGAGS